MSQVSDPPKRKAAQFFYSYKTRSPIQYMQRWQWDWLVWATIEPSIEGVETADKLPEEIAAGDLPIRVHSAGAARYFLLTDKRARSTPGFGIIKRSEVLSDPRFVVARSIWRERQQPIPYAVLHALGTQRKFGSIEELNAHISTLDLVDDPTRILATCWARGLLDPVISLANRKEFLSSLARSPSFSYTPPHSISSRGSSNKTASSP